MVDHDTTVLGHFDIEVAFGIPVTIFTAVYNGVGRRTYVTVLRKLNLNGALGEVKRRIRRGVGRHVEIITFTIQLQRPVIDMGIAVEMAVLRNPVREPCVLIARTAGELPKTDQILGQRVIEIRIIRRCCPAVALPPMCHRLSPSHCRSGRQN